MESIPVLDYSKATTDRAGLSREMTEVMSEFGFLFLDKIPEYREDELRWCVDFFFALPLSKRMEVARKMYNPENKNRYRGYFGVNQVGSSFKEGFEMGPTLPLDDPDLKTGFPITEHTPWPQPDEGQDGQPFVRFRETMERYFDLLYRVSLDLLRLLAIGLGLNENYLDELYNPKHISTFRLINYPVHNFEIPGDAYSPDDGVLLSTAAHRDTNTLTLLSTFDYEGLQVQRSDGSWLDAGTKKDCLIVNLGETIARLTHNRVKATTHRVRAIGRPRQAVPFFLSPAYHALMPKSLPEDPKKELSATAHSKEDCFEYGPWCREWIKRYVEYKGFDE